MKVEEVFLVVVVVVVVAADSAWSWFFQQDCPSCHIFGSDMAGCNLTRGQALPDCLPDDLVALFLRTYEPTTLPDDFFGRHTQIEALAIQHVPRRLTLGPLLFLYLPALQKLEFDDAHLVAVDPGQLFPLPELRILILNDTSLHQLPEVLLSRSRKLWFLDASNNQLTGLPEDLFVHNALLAEVYLARNRLFSLPAGLFRRNRKLRKVALNKNRLLTLPPGLLAQNKALELVRLGANPWTCDCRLSATLDKVSRRGVNVTGPPPKCHRPRNLKGLPVAKLKCPQKLTRAVGKYKQRVFYSCPSNTTPSCLKI